MLSNSSSVHQKPKDAAEKDEHNQTLDEIKQRKLSNKSPFELQPPQ